MLKLTTTIGAALLLALSVASVATAANENAGDHARDLAAKLCAADKKADNAAFKAQYGEHAMRNCIKGTTAEFKNAAKECKALREDDSEGFQETYGSNHNGRNALGKCISQTVRDSEEEPS